MDVITLHSRDVPAEHRFEWWCDLISRDVAPTRISTDHVTDFHAAAGAVDLGPVQLSALSFPPLRSTRTPALIRRSDPEVYELALIMGSEMWISQARSETRMRAGDLVLWETSHPFDGRGLGGNDQSRAIILHLPRATLPLPATRVDLLLAQAMPARSGMGAILARYLRSVLREAPTLDRADADRLGRTAWDLAAAFLAHRLGVQDRLPVESRRQALLARIDTFIDHHLSDSGLTPPAVAARHHISVRSLHMLFQQRGEGVAARISAWSTAAPTSPTRSSARCRSGPSRPGTASPPPRTSPAPSGPRTGCRRASTDARPSMPPLHPATTEPALSANDRAPPPSAHFGSRLLPTRPSAAEHATPVRRSGPQRIPAPAGARRQHHTADSSQQTAPHIGTTSQQYASAPHVRTTSDRRSERQGEPQCAGRTSSH